ncbi:MAG: hypothetical protein EHM18_02285 [Acidobacteria bacterium]|nr:MAG: hypothetical protein EHM18_02285 [Acidobacteriota bacterium]
MIRVGNLVAGKGALLDLEIVQLVVIAADRINPVDGSRLRMFDNRHSKNLQPLNGDVTGLDLHAIRHASERIRAAKPLFRKRHGVDQSRHSTRVPIRVVRKDGGADRQPVGLGVPAGWLEDGRFTDRVNAFCAFFPVSSESGVQVVVEADLARLVGPFAGLSPRPAGGTANQRTEAL